MNIDELCSLCTKYSTVKTTLKLRESDLPRFLESWDENSDGIKNKRIEISHLNKVLRETSTNINTFIKANMSSLDIISTTINWKGAIIKVENDKVYTRAFGTSINNKSMHHSWLEISSDNIADDLKKDLTDNGLL